MALPLLEEIEICITHISTPTHDHVVNPEVASEVLSRASKGIRLGELGLVSENQVQSLNAQAKHICAYQATGTKALL